MLTPIDADVKHLEPVDCEWLLQVVENALSTVAGSGIVVRQRIEQQQEFVAADARQHVASRERGREIRAAIATSSAIADGVAVVVVDVLEVVEVDERERKRGRGSPAPISSSTRSWMKARLGRPVSSSK